MQSWYPLKEVLSGEKSIILKNSVGKQWVVPVQNVKTGMNIYQPSSLKGKGIKLLLPYIKFFTPVLKKININTMKFKVDDKLEQYLKKKVSPVFQYSVFYGTPSPNQKVTMQLNQGKNCIAYVKITNKEHIWEYFKDEYKLLKELEEKGILGIPKALAIEKIDDKFIFVQSGNKSGKEKVLSEFGDVHYEFLKDMKERTRIEKTFVETEYAKGLEELQDYKEDFKSDEKETIDKSIESVKEKFASEREYMVYHGDFTPWNMYLKANQLNVFDFEYAKREYPKYLDIFHFHTQVWNLVEHRSKEDIWKLYQQHREEWKQRLQVEDVDIYYMAYLLEIIRLSKGLEKETNMQIYEESYELWSYLLERLESEKEK